MVPDVFHRDFTPTPYWWEAYTPEAGELADLPTGQFAQAEAGHDFTGDFVIALARPAEPAEMNVACGQDEPPAFP